MSAPSTVAARRLARSSALMLLAATSTLRAALCEVKPLPDFQHAELGPIVLMRASSPRATMFVSRMHVNPDGAPDAYHPDDTGIVHLCNGISVGAGCTWKPKCMPDFRRALAEGFIGPTRICFFAMATDASGVPRIQDAHEPRPGYYISTTALQHRGKDKTRAEGQLDSNTIPFAVIPKGWNKAASDRPRLGDFGVAYRKSTGTRAFFVVGDLGPARKLGEGSIALHQALGNDPFMLRFGTRRAFRSIATRDIGYLIFDGSADPDTVLTAASITAKGEALLAAAGGTAWLDDCLSKL